ncbi:MAG: uroporphyrinogen decarboxylase [Saprospiraceae bacterium]|jgi:uroporphyrinogen decarboxylase
MTLKNDRFLKALACEPVDCTPVWMMRQAGRYLPEYRATRERTGDFLTLCKTPELACEVTLQPLERFELDAAILFSDILTIPDAMGLGLSLNEGVGPVFSDPIRTTAQIDQLAELDVENELTYVFDAVKLIRQELDGRVPLIGFTGSPWTLMTYMVEGGGSKDFKYAKGMIFNENIAANTLLQKVTNAVITYLKAQVKAGAQTLMIFDTWGGLLSTKSYHEFSLQYMQQIVQALKSDPLTKHVPVVLFTKGGGQWLEAMAAIGCDALGLDWTTSMGQARTRLGDKMALQGNMDPTVLYAGPDTVRSEVRHVLDDFGQGVGNGNGHIFNLGHGIHPGIDPENVKAMVDEVHEYSARTLVS